ncbi:site-specific DNA-methyltransferase [Clostridium sp. WB02_MRS01]|uniref:DNA methyltransferase n=1 Tax=Clostridium sp. WB02_MRS01 TaxID=2605777 RepID=UPI0012B3D565|nr:site-specific DNA-methyltransferase [Clostridium sp. WB02_MRS01]
MLGSLETNSVDSCISDFPYDLSFMGKKWDSTGNFYEWNKERAVKLFRVVKPGGCVAIFGHPKTNHRMKCAFEDSGFKIVEEIDWIYLTGMPKNQDIGKLFDKAAGAERKVVGIDKSKLRPNRKCENDGAERVLAGGFKSDNGATITEPACELAKKWNGWKTSGLKPAHEPITIFQKPLEGTYIQNIEKYDCGAMNIDACRIPISKEDIEILNAKASKTPTTNYSDRDDRIYGKYAEDKAMPPNELGRFPSNIVVDEYAADLLDVQIEDGSKYFTVIKYEPKISPSERKLPNGERNPHVTPKPVALIKWLIKLLTPINGMTIDITAGSCTHAVACEELNKSDGYGLKYINVELMNTEEEPYCSVGGIRVKAV